MTTISNDPSETQSVKPNSRFLFHQNPILRKEIHTRMRSLRAFALVTIFLGIVSASAVLVLALLFFTTNQPGMLEILQRAGTFVFYTIFLVEMFSISFIAPALTSGVISAEKEYQTFDLLRTTLLSTSNIVLGKLSASIGFLLLLLLSTLPLYAMAFTFGGISLGQIIIAWLILIWTTVVFASLGMFFSSFIRRTIFATVASYVIVGIFMIGIPTVLVSSISILASLIGVNLGTPSIASQVFLFTLGWILVLINPLSTAVVTEIANINNQTLWLLELPLSNNAIYTLPSPWLPYLIFCSIIIVSLILLSIRLTARPEK